MYIKRVYNNNVVMVDDAGTERIAVGKGIAFGRKRGDVA
ncbi:MAG: CAT RNA binding domain-containing protein [Collinsella sp.]